MKRSLAAVAAVVAVVVVAATASAVTIAVRDDGIDTASRSMMSSGTERGSGPEDRAGGGAYGRGGPMGGGPMMGDADVTDEFSYLAHMVAHHEEAVTAAEELARSERPQMQAFGRSIVASQSAQIDQMRSWLETWYPDRSTEVDYQPMMRDLSGLSGKDLDRVFLQDMVVHHMAAVMMSQRLLASDGAEHPEVEALARDIRDEQHTEILRMSRWLSTWYGGPGMVFGMGGGMGPWMGPGMMS